MSCKNSQDIFNNIPNVRGKNPHTCDRNWESPCTITCQNIVNNGVTYYTRTPEELTYNMECVQKSRQTQDDINDIGVFPTNFRRPLRYWKLREPTGSNIGYYANRDWEIGSISPNNYASSIGNSKGCYYTCDGIDTNDNSSHINCPDNGIPAYPNEVATQCTVNRCKPGYSPINPNATGTCILNGRDASYDIVQCSPDNNRGTKRKRCAAAVMVD